VTLEPILADVLEAVRLDRRWLEGWQPFLDALDGLAGLVAGLLECLPSSGSARM